MLSAATTVGIMIQSQRRGAHLGGSFREIFRFFRVARGHAKLQNGAFNFEDH